MTVVLRCPFHAAAIAAVLLAWPAHSQIRPDTNAFGWLIYEADHPIHGRWGLHLEGQIRREDIVLRPQQLVFRPALNVDLTDSLTAAFGYTYSRTYPYGADPDPFAFPEHRVFEQLTAKHKLGRWTMSHRIRVEQRFIAQAGTVPEPIATAWRYANRFRYALRGRRELSDKTYFFASIEPQIRFGIHYRGRAIDQQQSFVSVGRKIAPGWFVETGYGYQTGVPRRGEILEHNHIIEVVIRSEAPFRRLGSSTRAIFQR
jgi:hypothetical protein